MDAIIFIWLIISFLSGCLITFLATYRRKPALKLGELIEVACEIYKVSDDHTRNRAFLSELLDYMLTYGKMTAVSPELFEIITKVKDEFKQSKK